MSDADSDSGCPEVMTAHQDSLGDHGGTLAPAAEPTAAIKTKPQGTSCVACSGVDLSKKYKCPSCRSPYCSLACYKVHKQACVRGAAAAVPETSQVLDPTPPGRKRQRSARPDEMDELVGAPAGAIRARIQPYMRYVCTCLPFFPGRRKGVDALSSGFMRLGKITVFAPDSAGSKAQGDSSRGTCNCEA